MAGLVAAKDQARAKSDPKIVWDYLSRENVDKIWQSMRTPAQVARARMNATGQTGPTDIEKPGAPLPPPPVLPEPARAAPDQIEQRNRPYVAPGAQQFSTSLAPPMEGQFRRWVADNRIPFDPNDAKSDYDMRGYWLASRSPGVWQGLQAEGKIPADMAPGGTKVDPNDGHPHFPDYWKTPYHETFSNESKFAGPNAPHWTDDDKLVAADGKVLFDDRAPKAQVNPEAWRDVMGGALPVTETGKTYTHALWADRLTYLLQHQDPKTIEAFDKYYGPRGFKAEDLIRELTAPTIGPRHDTAREADRSMVGR